MNFGRHLLVDGSNILHAWPELRSLAAKDRNAARAQLLQRLTAIHDNENVRVTVVFDGRGDQLVIEHPFDQPTFSVIHTSSGLTADDVIEQMVANAAQPAMCVVATDDRAERQTTAASGADVLRSEDLAAWVMRAEARQGAVLEARRATNTRAWKKP